MMMLRSLRSIFQRRPGLLLPDSTCRFLGTSRKTKKIFFQSLGCPRNFVDTEVMLGYSFSQEETSMELAESMDDADVVVINTCGFLESSRKESMAAIEDAQNHRKKNGKVVVTGCMVNLPKQQEQVRKDFPGVDAILSSGNIDGIVETIQGITNKKKNRKPKQQSTRKQRKSFLEKGETPRFLATPPHYAYLKIAEGCRKRCSFCIIPKLKGRLQSKPIDQVVDEFQAILQHGSAREVILIAQDLGDYGLDFDSKSQLTDLLRAILSSMDVTEGDDDDSNRFWLRLLYLYPDEITPDLIDLMESDSRIARYVDLPIQHSHDDILKAMRRKTNSEHIKSTIRNLRERLPDIVIRTSLMVGFPGETEEHFEDLLNFVKEYKLDHVGVFVYSNEEMAYSSRMEGQVPEDIKEDRYFRLMQAQWEVVEASHKERLSQKLCVVIEGVQEGSSRVVGRHVGQCPEIDGQVILEGDPRVYPGERYWVQVTGYEGYDLVGKVLNEEPRP